MAVALTPDSPRAAIAGRCAAPIVSKASGADRVFRGILRGAGIMVLAITGLILIFLILRSFSAFQRAGFGFFTTSSFFPETSSQFGIAALLPDSALIAVIALVGRGARRSGHRHLHLRVRAVRPAQAADRGDRPDGRDTQHRLRAVGPVLPDAQDPGLDQWLAHHLGFVPFFHFTKADTIGNYVGAMFIAGLVVSLMVIPIITSLSRQVFSQAPQGEREAPTRSARPAGA